jgi:hypothetical protein
MSRHGYSDDCDDDLALGRWRAQVMSATRGKRGQEFFRDLVSALEAMPTKRLIAKELIKDGEVCALGAVGLKRGVHIDKIDPEDHEIISIELNVAEQLSREVAFQNDDGCYDGETPEQRWARMYAWAKENIRPHDQAASSAE